MQSNVPQLFSRILQHIYLDPLQYYFSIFPSSSHVTFEPVCVNTQFLIIHCLFLFPCFR
jgi:hypothetical protein